MDVKRVTLTVAAFVLSNAVLCARADDLAPPNLSLSDVLAKAATASGSLAPGAYSILTRTVHGDGTISTTTTFRNGDDFKSVSKSGPFTTLAGSVHGQAWHMSPNKVVTLETGFHDADNADRQALKDARSGSSAVKLLGMTAAAPQQYVIDVAPPNADRELLYIDAGTFLISRIDTDAQDGTHNRVLYSDYRTVFGLKRPFKVEYTDERAVDDATSTTVSYERMTSPVDFTIPDTTAVFAFPTDAPVKIPAQFTEGGIAVRVTIDGKGYDLALDSGASDINVDAAMAHGLNLSLYGKTVELIGGNFDNSEAVIPKVHVGDLEANNLAVSVIPFALQTGQDVKTVGLLGADFISSGVLEIDFKNKAVTMYPWDQFDPKKINANGIPIENDDDVPRFPLSVNGVTGHFLLDLGASRTIFLNSFVHGVPDAEKQGFGDTLGFIGGDVNTHSYQLSNVVFGGIRFLHANILVPDDDGKVNLQGYDGIIGRDVLQNFVIYLDYVHSALYLKPNPQ